jgi:hypothetical protein
MKINKDIIFLCLLIFIAIISHIEWFNIHSILTSGDWQFRYSDLLKDFLGGWNTWVSFESFGLINIQMSTFPLRGFVWFVLAQLGFPYDLIVKITLLFFIDFGGFLFPYILAKRLVKDSFVSFVASLTYATTIYFLIIQTRHLFIAFIFCLLPLIIYFFDKALKNNKIIDWVVFSIIFIIGFIYELRMMYIVCLVLFLYFIAFYLKKIKSYLLTGLFSTSLILLLSLYWIMPFVLIANNNIFSETVGRRLFGDHLFSVNQAFTIFRWSWTGGFEDRSFVVQPIQWYLWLIPLTALTSLIFKNKYRKKILFFAFLFLLGVFLTKQSVEPLSTSYLWLYKFFPGFNLFREASKFYMITAFAYLGLTSYTLLHLKNSKVFKKLYIIFCISLLLIAAINLKPLITTEIGGIFVDRSEQIPNDYLVLKDFIKKQNIYFRVGWVPAPVSWGYYTDNNPRVAFTEFQSSKWNYLQTHISSGMTLPILEPLMYSYSKSAFEQLSVKYFILPIQEKGNYSDVFESYGGKENPNIRDWYIAELDKINWLKKIDIGTNELVVYENENYKPHIYTDNGFNYFQTNASEFGDFSQNQNLYINSEIEENDYLFGKLDNVIVPIEADSDKVAEMKLEVDKTSDTKEKKELEADLDLYVRNLFFKDFKLEIPVKATYKIYLRTDSVLANTENVGIQVADKILQQNTKGTDKEGWKYFNQIELEKGEYEFNLYIGNTISEIINSCDIVFSAENLVEPIKTPQLEYKQMNPTKYIVNVHNASESFPLIFSESFHPGWKLYIQPALADQGTGKFISENNQGTIQNENLYSDKFYDLLFRKPVSDDRHFLINGFANSWWIDVSELQKQGEITKNADGTYDFSVYIEFEPQKYFYIGLLISSLTLVACLGYLVYIFLFGVYNKKRKKQERS